ncbi:hypothetical protein SAMN05192573_102296 [Mucilaginibacter gossypii]|uniref:Uncharacterized protein n=1 Tax=Mucilaginibacter gossypii TaxID=551996 RepID=A0A1G7RMZ5_9SPHI|nr:hypothetical protein SAMN05192573_102296 [Mucilaginibacter gossypii]
MRKKCALFLTAFYLVLTTGLYACLAHCALEFIGTKLGLVHNVTDNSKNSDKDEEPCDDYCKCCYHHGVYVVQENFSPDDIFHFVYSQPIILTKEIKLIPNTPTLRHIEVKWPRATGPPNRLTAKLYISYRSILI